MDTLRRGGRPMHQLLSPKAHAPIDYLVVIAFLFAPTLFEFVGVPRTLCYAFAVLHLALTLFTAFPGGLIKRIPFTVHGTLEAILAPVLIALPFLLGFKEVEGARNFFIGTG